MVLPVCKWCGRRTWYYQYVNGAGEGYYRYVNGAGEEHDTTSM